MSSFWLRDRTQYPAAIDSWPLPAEPAQVELAELNWLTRELDRYVRGSIRGRSYLIAGHRGAGKTALANRAVETVRTEVIRQSTIVDNPDLPDAPFQRPLLVKLHGPSMLELPSPSLSPSPAPSTTTPPQSDTSAPATGLDTQNPAAHAALIHMTIGLYRALATEVAVGYRAHALELVKQGRAGDFPELAAQLALNLDSAAEPGMIREFWSAIGRLKKGVLWPKRSDKQLADRRMTDQGLREAIALVTAGQAFQVCSGQVSYTAKQVDKVVTNDFREIKADSNLKEVASRLGTLGLGTLAGVAVLGSQGPLAAVGSGLAVWLLGNLTVSWTRTRTRNDDRSIDYSFIRDFKPHTLDRDLPVVIARVREAGLAPVFVIDELDKVDDAPRALGTLVARLKHLITDFGFFCFLVNRDTYEQIERAIHEKAYPPEHTFFSDRLLLYPRSDAFRRYLISLAEADDPQDQAARAVFALGIMQEARLNFTDMMRFLARAAKRRDGYVGEAHEVQKPRRLVLATVQIAIDEVLRSPLLVDRMESNAGFAQLALDTLYFPSLVWSGGDSRFDPTRGKLKAYLDQRLGRIGDPTSPNPGPEVDEADLDLLHRALVDLLDLLSNLKALRVRVGDQKVIGSPDVDEVSDVYLKDLPPVGVKAICTPEADGTFCFQFTRDGDPMPDGTYRLSLAQRERIDILHEYWTLFKEIVDLSGMTFDQLASTPLLTSFSLAALDAADAALQAARTTERADKTILDHLALLERLHAEIQKQGTKIGTFLILNRSVLRDVGEGREVFGTVSRLVRFEGRPDHWVAGSRSPNRPIPAKVEGLQSWRDQFLAWLLSAHGDPPVQSPPTFGSLLDPLRQYFGSPRRTIYEPTYQAFVQAARGELPAAALYSDLRALKAGDWSALALAAIPTRHKPADAPFWLLVAALRALGFGRTGLIDLCDPDLAEDLRKERWKVEDEGLTTEECFREAKSIAAGASKRTAGLVVIETDDEPYSPEQVKGRRGVLVVHERDYGNYLPALQWLGAIGILGGQADARGEPTR